MFEDRISAGLQLAKELAELPMTDPVVLALPRGGAPVALPVAQALHAPMDLILIRKIGMPSNPELAAGALAEGSNPISQLWGAVARGSDQFGYGRLAGAGAAPARLRQL